MNGFPNAIQVDGIGIELLVGEIEIVAVVGDIACLKRLRKLA